MSGKRIPVEGITRDAEPDVHGWIGLHWPNGRRLAGYRPAELRDLGITVPERPIAVGDTVCTINNPRVLATVRYVHDHDEYPSYVVEYSNGAADVWHPSITNRVES